jgi:hypothetical protein
VYLVRFVVDLELDNETYNVSSSESDEIVQHPPKRARSLKPTATKTFEPPQSFPASISIDQLMKAGKFVKPIPKTRAVLNLESFDVAQKEWVAEKPINVIVENEKFASGAFRDAFRVTSEGVNKKQWVIKKYNDNAKTTIVTTLASTIEIHTRKQVQMHSVARQLTKKFSSKLPKSFGKSFSYNKVFFAMYDGQPVTVEEFVPGTFTRYINNDGQRTQEKEDRSDDQEVYDKAESLVHYTYTASKGKLMLLDIQGSEYTLYDPEIATSEIFDDEDEVLFCCGNLSTVSIDRFLAQHKCSKFCNMAIEPEK